MASPEIAGMVALAQQLAVQELGRRLSFDEIRSLFKSTGDAIVDGDNENDNVPNTDLTFYRADMLALAEAILNLKPPSSYSVTVTAGSTVGDKDFGFAATTAVQALSGDDVVFGTAYGEELRGGAGADQINGGPGDDHLYGEGGDDTLNGGDGFDQVFLKGDLANYTLAFSAKGYTVSDNMATDGTDTLANIEQLVFSDVTLSVDTSAPTVITFSPSDEATGIVVGSNIVLSFSEAIAKGVGNIVLKTVAGAVLATYDAATSLNLSFSGSALTINPTADLGYSTGYSVELAAGSIKDIAGNSYAGTTAYNFTTSAAPQLGSDITANFLAYSWNVHTLLASVDLASGAHQSRTDLNGAASFMALTDASLTLQASRPIPTAESADTTNAVNLQDAIAILKMIVGLNVNGANQALSPYQALAADFDGNGRVELNDAIGVLKHVVGLTGTGTPKPEWRFVDEASAAVVAIKDAAALSPGQPPAINLDLTGADATVHVGLVGYLRGDVDGSFAGAAGALDLDATQPGYFTALVAEQPALNLAQFGIYSSV
jgi:hypothetical protein